MKRRYFIFPFLLLMALALSALLGTKGLQFAAMAEASEGAGPPPSTVATFTVESQDWVQRLEAVGSIQPVKGVVLEAESPGIVKAIHFENGQKVAAGDLLVQFDVSVESAQLRAAEATVRLAELELTRTRSLREGGNVPQSSLDAAVADRERAQAEVENLQAVIDRKTIRAPFAGRVGIRQINLGQFVPAGSPLVPLQSYDQVYVNFSLPQQALSQIEEGFALELETDAFPGRRFAGVVTALSPEIDPTTRTIEVQGTLDNPDGALRAGLFVRIDVILPERRTVLVVPTTAVLFAPYGNSIFKVVEDAEGDGLLAKQHFVRLGQTRGDFVEVHEGVAAGEQIVSAGAFKLRNNAAVQVNNDNAPKPELNPTPENS